MSALRDAVHVAVWSNPGAGLSMDDARSLVDALFAPDGPLAPFLVLGPDGEPVDPTAALRALGEEARQRRGGPYAWLDGRGVTGALAEVCLYGPSGPEAVGE